MTTEATPAAQELDPANGLSGPFARLVLAAEAVRRKRTERDVRKLLQFLGMLAITFGFLSIGLGWYGAAHSGYQYEEIPFVISGGIFGLGLVVAGGALFFAGWTLRQIEELRRTAGESHRDLTQVVQSLEGLREAVEGLARAGHPGTSDHPEEEGHQ